MQEVGGGVQPQASLLMLHALDSLVAAVLVGELGVRALCGRTNYPGVGAFCLYRRTVVAPKLG